MSHTSESGAINSGAINHVSFPGTESGLSLVQPVGTVSVTADITGIYLLLKASATTPAVASTSLPSAILRNLLGATTACASTTSAGVVSKVSRKAIEPAKATGKVTIGRIIPRSASTTSIATAASISARSKVFFGAAQPAVAAVSVESRKNVYLAASAIANSVSSASTLRKRQLSATTVGDVNFLVTIGRLRRLSATAIGRALPVPGIAALRLPIGASTTATIDEATTAFIALRRFASTVPQAIVAGTTSYARFRLGASSSPQADGVASTILHILRFNAGYVRAEAIASATARLGIPFGATTVADAESYVVAADLNITQPAPEDRQMIVPLEERRMEVAAS